MEKYSESVDDAVELQEAERLRWQIAFGVDDGKPGHGDHVVFRQEDVHDLGSTRNVSREHDQQSLHPGTMVIACNPIVRGWTHPKLDLSYELFQTEELFRVNTDRTQCPHSK